MTKKVALILAGMVDLELDPFLFFDRQRQCPDALHELREDWVRVGRDLSRGMAFEKKRQTRGNFGDAQAKETAAQIH